MNIKEFKRTAYLAPDGDNPRNSEGAFVTLDDGRIAFAYSRYYGEDADDFAQCSIAAVFSYDGGESWDTENYRTLVTANGYGEKNVMSVSVMRMENGDIGLYYILKHKGLTTSYILRRYDGNFENVISETKCLPCQLPGYYVINNDRVFKTSDGRLIIPTALHPTSMYRDIEKPYFDGRSETRFFVSSDDGRTWEMLHVVLRPTDNYSESGLQEPGLAELHGGILYCYSRTERGYQHEAISIDAGESWYGPRPSKFMSPCSPMLIKKNPYSGKYYAIWNPMPEYQTRPKSKVWTGGRNPLVIAVSDDGMNFSEPAILENDSERGFCYPALYFLDENTALTAYCSGGAEEGGCLNRTTLAKLCF